VEYREGEDPHGKITCEACSIRGDDDATINTCPYCYQQKEMPVPCPFKGGVLGDWVVYQATHPWAFPEDGIITGWSETSVFVLFEGKLHPRWVSPGDLRKGAGKW